jgi:predicted nucleic acid-binding protein
VAEPYKRPCFDSSIFIGGIGNEICRGVKRGVIYQYLMDRVRCGDFRVLVSSLAIAEVFKKKRFPGPPDTVLDEFIDLVEGPHVDVIEVDREVAIHAHRLCRQYRVEELKPADAIHLACALGAECDVLLTWDRPLQLVKHASIRIEEPSVISRDLFTESEFATENEIKEYERQRKSGEQWEFVCVRTPMRRCGGDATVIDSSPATKKEATSKKEGDGNEQEAENPNPPPAQLLGGGEGHPKSQTGAEEKVGGNGESTNGQAADQPKDETVAAQAPVIAPTGDGNNPKPPAEPNETSPTRKTEDQK